MRSSRSDSRQLHCFLDRLVRNPSVMERFVRLAQSKQDLACFLRRRFFDDHGLEAACECRIAFKALLILVKRRRADDLNLAARKGRL